MKDFPHYYDVTVTGSGVGDVELRTDRLPPLPSASPREFDGPGDRWPPETLLVAAVGDCLILTFRAVARASGLAWNSLECDVRGTLDRVDRTTRFVEFENRACLRVPYGTNPDRARQVLEKAERNCLISNSLSAATRLVPTIEVAVATAADLIQV